MSKDPAILFYYKDYVHGTRWMTFEEKGAYMELLCEQADIGHMSLEYIMRILQNSTPIWDAICKKYDRDENGLYYNKILDEHLTKRRKYTESRKNNLKGSHMRSHMQSHVVNVNEDVNENKNVVKVINNRKEQILIYCQEQGYPIEEGEAFFDHYQALGWLTNAGLGIVDWKAKMRTWHKEQTTRKSNGLRNTQQGKGSIDPDKYKRLASKEPIL